MDTFKKEIYSLALHDATVRAYVALYEHSDMSYSDMLEQLVINLQAEKDCYFKQAVKLLQESPPKPQIIEQSDSAEKTQPSGETNKQSTPCKKMISCGLLYDSELCDNGFRECYE